MSFPHFMAQRSTVEYAKALARSVDAKAGYFPGHSDGVAYMVRLMTSGREGWTRERIAELELAAMLHDVGKIMIPDSILTKPSKLTVEEYETIKTHSMFSYAITKSIDAEPVMDRISKWIRHHHEHWNGTGYPDHLSGDEIPLESRILLVADAFHVLTNERPYKHSVSRTEAIEELKTMARVQFCPVSVDLLLDRSEALPE